MTIDPVFFLLKFKQSLFSLPVRQAGRKFENKRIIEARIQIVRYRGRLFLKNVLEGLPRWPDLKRYLSLVQKAKAEIRLEGILRGSVVIVVLVFLLSFGTGQTVSGNGTEKPIVLRPTLLADASLPPKITARSAYLLDLKSGFVFYDKNSFLKLPPASTTKIAAALVALDNYELNEVVVVHPSCVLRTGESIMGLYSQEKIAVRDLLRGMLIASASDAACALATHHPEGMLEFIGRMNALVASLGLGHTYFVNPSGMDSTHQYSTAQELTLLAKKASKISFIREVIATKEINVTSVDGRSWHYLKSTNELLGEMPGISGVKTGYTAKAKEVFIFYFRAEQERKEILGTVMGSADRFGDAKALLNWVLYAFAFP